MMPADFVQLLGAFENASVRYLLIGGYAVSLLSKPRSTKDMHLLIDPDEANRMRVSAALLELGISPSLCAEVRQMQPDDIVFFGREPMRVDLLCSTRGFDFATAYARRSQILQGGVRISVIHIDDLIANKRAVGRAQDHADVVALERTRAAMARGPKI
jgi:hypothetical protein